MSNRYYHTVRNPGSATILGQWIRPCALCERSKPIQEAFAQEIIVQPILQSEKAFTIDSLGRQTAEIPINGPLQVSYTEFQWRAKGASEWNIVRVPGTSDYIDFGHGPCAPNAVSPGMEWQGGCIRLKRNIRNRGLYVGEFSKYSCATNRADSCQQSRCI